MNATETATVTDVQQSSTSDLETVHADLPSGAVATLYYHPEDTPDVGADVPVFFEMGGWCTSESRVYQQREGYDD